MHGVGLNIGSSEPLDRAHLARLKVLCNLYQPECFSEHLAWSSHAGVFFNDLLPLPYAESNLRSVIDHIDEAQSTLHAACSSKTPRPYVRFQQSTIPETEFLAAIARDRLRTALDVNNVSFGAQPRN